MAPKTRAQPTTSRRGFLSSTGRQITTLIAGSSILSLLPNSVAAAPCDSLTLLGPLGRADANGVRLPPGFTSRIVAESVKRVVNSSYHWHIFPDGGATFPAPDGGWVYVSNSESEAFAGAGAGAIRFAPDGTVVDGYRILGNTRRNCAGGPTPWNTWLSCEEIEFGRVFECDPFGIEPPRERAGLGFFKHEAAAVDPEANHVYLTEDEDTGRLYRFVPNEVAADGRINLDSGALQAARVGVDGSVDWLEIPSPNPIRGQTPTREQVPETTVFDGGEGIWYQGGKVYFTTKGGTQRVWELDTRSQRLRFIYDRATAPDPLLSGVDNVTVSAGGDVLVAEDGGDMQLVVVGRDGTLAPLLQIVDQEDSEIAGPAFDPSGTRLYFSSQRGALGRCFPAFGLTYEVTGPFPQCLGSLRNG